MPLLDFVLKGGVRNSVKAAGAMHAHLAALNRAYRFDLFASCACCLDCCCAGDCCCDGCGGV
ncbi:hypothetical protein PUN28_001847 [Cardiocondyla obscurior]|uniref:Uncharacterized protein n=1 Tax=Cardiocondyla obscurior TaxID=286306 RepID=A0AAW2GRI6_9HYME